MFSGLKQADDQLMKALFPKDKRQRPTSGPPRRGESVHAKMRRREHVHVGRCLRAEQPYENVNVLQLAGNCQSVFNTTPTAREVYGKKASFWKTKAMHCILSIRRYGVIES